MQLSELCVFHLSKAGIQSASVVGPAFSSAGTFYLDTCQRWLWICNFQRLSPEQNEALDTPKKGLEVYRGSDAYLFLLRLAAGLESEVLGETDVFGQFKEAWRKIEASTDSVTDKCKDEFAGEIAPWIHRVFEDTKEIRTRYLQKLGGSSYGSLVRKLIRDQQGSTKKPVLLVGAGQIAQSVAPFLLDSELLLSNRHVDRLTGLYSELSQKSKAQVKILETPEEELQGWQDASHVVMCIPIDFEQDQARIDWLKERTTSNPIVVHLGGMREHCGPWASLPNFFCLSDLFQLQNSLGNVRSVQIAYAEKACEERAKLRSLGASLSIPHGWEDLALFA